MSESNEHSAQEAKAVQDAPDASTITIDTAANESGTVKKRTRKKVPTEAEATAAKAEAEAKAKAEAEAAEAAAKAKAEAEAAAKAKAEAEAKAKAEAEAAAKAKAEAEAKAKAAPAAALAAAAKAAGKTAPAVEEGPKRRVRRSRSIATKEGEERPRQRRRRKRAEGDEPKPAKPGEGGRTAPAPRKGGRGRQTGGSAMERLLATPRRTIYRQDMGGDAPPPAPESEAAQAADKGKAKAKAKPSDNITLILHPAPKAAPQRRKKQENRPKTAKEALRAKAKRRKKGGGKQAAAGKAKKAVKLQDAWIEATGSDAVSAAVAAAGGGEALVKAWLDKGNADAIAHVAAADAVKGKARKAARRALNVLKSRGVDIPEVEQAAADPVLQPAGETIVATFVPPDGAGVSFFSISRHQPGSRFQVADAVIRPPLGIVQASSGWLAGKQIRAWRNRVQEHFGASPVEVPLSWARHRIAAARKLNDSSNQLVPLGFDRCQELFAPVPEEAPDHPLAELDASVDSASIDKARGDSDKLHSEPEFRSWMPDAQAMQELLAKVGEKVGEEGVKDPAKVDEALKEEITAATDRWFSPERRAALCEHMRDSAISVRVRNGDDAAKRVLAVARAVKEAGLITSPPSEIPFLVAYFQKAVAVMLQQQGGMLRVPVPPGQRAQT